MTTKANEKLNLKQDDFLSVQTVGETMYITLKSLPVQHTLFNSAPQVKPTLVLPQNKNVEIRASNNELSLYPGQLQNNWFVQESSRVSVHLAKESDVSLTAVTNQKRNTRKHTLGTSRRFNEKRKYFFRRTSRIKQPRTLV